MRSRATNGRRAKSLPVAPTGPTSDYAERRHSRAGRPAAAAGSRRSRENAFAYADAIRGLAPSIRTGRRTKEICDATLRSFRSLQRELRPIRSGGAGLARRAFLTAHVSPRPSSGATGSKRSFRSWKASGAISRVRYRRGENASGVSNTVSTQESRAMSKPAMSALNRSLAI